LFHVHHQESVDQGEDESGGGQVNGERIKH